MKTISLKIIIYLVSMIVFSGCMGNKGKQEKSAMTKKTPLVNILSVTKRDISSEITIVGTVMPNTRSDIKSPVNGIIENLLARENDMVTKGQIVALVNPAERIAMIAKNKQEVLRLENVFKADAENDSLRQLLTEAKYDLDLAYKMYQLIPVTAELSGMVSQRFVDKGSEVTAKDKLLEIYDPKSLVIKAEVNEQYFSAIKKERKLAVRLNAYPDTDFTGAISLVYPKIEPVTRSVKFDIVLDKQVNLLEGMMAEINLVILNHKNALCIPDDALLTDISNQPFVYRVDNDSVARKTAVTPGISSDGYTEIITGLNENESVVVKGQEMLTDGKKVQLAIAQKPSAK